MPCDRKSHRSHQDRKIQEALSTGGNRAKIISPVLFRSGCNLPRLTFLHAWTRINTVSNAGTMLRKNMGRQPQWGKTVQNATGREQIPDGIALLQNSGKSPAPPRRDRFHRQRSAQSPIAAHADAEEQTQQEESDGNWGPGRTAPRRRNRTKYWPSAACAGRNGLRACRRSSAPTGRITRVAVSIERYRRWVCEIPWRAARERR